MALNRQIRGRVFFRTLYFMPVVSSTVAVTMVWRWMYAPFGVINALLTGLGLPPVGWLTTPAWAMPAVILMSVWQSMGHSMVIYLAGLQGIPRHLYDAAAVDGATGWRQFWHITLPLLSPTTFFVLVMAVIRSFQAFGQVYMLTGAARRTPRARSSFTSMRMPFSPCTWDMPARWPGCSLGSSLS